MNYRAMNTQEVKDRCADICMQFGDGETEFSTRDVNHLLSQLHVEESQNAMLVKECEDLQAEVLRLATLCQDRNEQIAKIRLRLKYEQTYDETKKA